VPDAACPAEIIAFADVDPKKDSADAGLNKDDAAELIFITNNTDD